MTNPQFYKDAIDATGCISNAWELIKPNYWLYLGITLVAGLIIVALSCIPIVGIVMFAPVSAGIYYIALRAMRGEYIDFGMLFKGFEKFKVLALVGLIQGIPSIIGQILDIVFRVLNLLVTTSQRSRGVDYYQSNTGDFALAGGMLVVIIVVAVVIMLFSIAWSITFAFSVPIAMDQNVDAMTAIKLSARAGWSNLGGIIVLAILLALIGLASVIAICLLGPLWVSPIYTIAWAFAYRQVFPDLGPSQYRTEPPSPEYYQGSFGQGM